MIKDTRKTEKPLQGQKNSLNHILIVKNLYFEFDGKRVGAQQATFALQKMDVVRKEPIKGGVYYELKERESK